MWNIGLLAFLTFALPIAVNLPFSHHFTFAQINESEENGTSNNNLIFIRNNNMATGPSTNNTGIMQNTSGIIDDAYDLLEDSFGSFFGK